MTPRILRRELHASRAVPAVLTAALVVLGSALLFLEAVLKAVGDPPFLLDFERAAAWLGSLPPGVPPAVLGTGSFLLFVVGLVLFLLAVLPGRRVRYVVPSERAGVVVDAEVLASALARRARLAAGVAPEQVMVTVGRRTADVQVRPTSGIPVDAAAVQAAVEDDLRYASVEPQPVVRVRIAPSGVIGQ
ncbi:hypothetical protein IWX65_001403 [Arthrobacter sp. CAN_A214]|uniref:DUF6286 domain-containing protein n=1 Tax=Arthrobacter sp. CAN_A214 TaxID=2787720 RepID=UPI001A1AA514